MSDTGERGPGTTPPFPIPDPPMTTQALKALEPCPFCGRQGRARVITDDQAFMPPNHHYVACSCGAGGPNERTDQDATAAWNRRAREAYRGSGETVREIARALCREKCAYYGEPPCFEMTDDKSQPLPWPNPNCDEPGCQAEAEAVASLSRPAMPEGYRDAVIEECATLLEDRYFEPNYAEAIRALKTPSPDNERDSTEKKECGRMKT